MAANAIIFGLWQVPILRKKIKEKSRDPTNFQHRTTDAAPLPVLIVLLTSHASSYVLLFTREAPPLCVQHGSSLLLWHSPVRPSGQRGLLRLLLQRRCHLQRCQPRLPRPLSSPRLISWRVRCHLCSLHRSDCQRPSHLSCLCLSPHVCVCCQEFASGSRMF